MRRFVSPLTASQKSERIDLNPMLDVVFILLIFFIVTSVFVREAGIDANPPDPDRRTDQQPGPNILVRIDSRNWISIAGRTVDVRRVAPHLAQLHAEKPEAGLVISVHDKSSVDVLVRVMDASRSVGIYNINFAD